MQNKTKIIATIGPSSSNQDIIASLIDEGVNIFRLNFSHGDRDTHENNIQTIRTVAKNKNKIISLIGDLQGPKIRIGDIKNNAVTIKKGNTLQITTKPLLGDEGIISTSYTGILKLIPKDKLLIDDGLIVLEVISTDKSKKEVLCKIIVGGVLKSKKGINIPSSNIDVVAFTDKDKEFVKFALLQELDFIALSFVRKPEDINLLRSFIKKHTENNYIPIIAKIERPEAIENIDAIIEKTDCLMVARGDLGVEMPLEQVPLLQKEIVLKCNRMSRPVIIATQMLESMIKNPRATRAEVSDIANAIIDGADAVMLSGETASGDYPIETIKTMHKIAIEIESTSKTLYYRKHGMDKTKDNDTEEAIAISACELAKNLKAISLTIHTNNPHSVQLLSKYHPYPNIIAITSNPKVACQVNLYWNVMPILVKKESLTNKEKLTITKNIITKNIINSKLKQPQIIIETDDTMLAIRIY